MMTREQRKARVAEFVFNAGPFVSISEIARGVGLRKTPYLREMLAELCDEGILGCSEHTFPNGTVGWLYLDARHFTTEGR